MNQQLQQQTFFEAPKYYWEDIRCCQEFGSKLLLGIQAYKSIRINQICQGLASTNDVKGADSLTEVVMPEIVHKIGRNS